MTDQPYRGLGEWWAAQRRAAAQEANEAELTPADETDKQGTDR